MISPKFFSDECLFQIISMDIDVRIKIMVQANTINEFEGVQTGRLIDLYQTLPTLAKYEEAEAVIITSSGMKK